MAQPVHDRALRGVGPGTRHFGWTDRRGQSWFLLLRGALVLGFGLVGVANAVAKGQPVGLGWVAPFVVAGAFLLWHDLRLQRAQRRLGVRQGEAAPPVPESDGEVPRYQMPRSMRTPALRRGELAGPGSLNRVAAERGIDIRVVRRRLPGSIRPRWIRVVTWLGGLTVLAGLVLFGVNGFTLAPDGTEHPAVLCWWVGGWAWLGTAGMLAFRTMGALRAIVVGIGPTERSTIGTEPSGSWRRAVLALHDEGWIRQFEGPPLTDQLRTLDDIQESDTRRDQG